jgi:hypothetical protein
MNRPPTRQMDRHRARWLWGLLGGMVLASGPSALYVLQQNECLRLSYEINALRERDEDLVEQMRRLVARRAALQSLDAIEEWAAGQGLVAPRDDQVIVLPQVVPPRPDLLARGASGRLAPRIGRTDGPGDGS